MFTVLKKQIITNPLLILLSALMLSPIAEDRLVARACWNDVLIECFDRDLLTWPWQNPQGSGRAWRCNPNPPNTRSWGIQDRNYSVDFGGLCNNDIQAVWCMGGSRQFDPDVDPYFSNLNNYITYGPFDLTNAVDAIVQFQLLCESELGGDSIVWGVANSSNLTMQNIMIDSAFSGSTTSSGAAWKWCVAHLGNLHDVNGNPVSALGLNQVYAFWWFTADGDVVDQPPAHQLDNGAFIDNVLIKWDDGGIDYRAGTLSLRHEDSSYVVTDPIVNDVVRTAFNWVTCAGGVDTFPDVRITVTVTNPLGIENIIYDETFTNVMQDSIHSIITDTWAFETDGQHRITLAIDPENLVQETRENNNRDSITVYAWPPNPHPTFTWLNPGPDTLFATDTAMMKWEAFDPGEAARIDIYIDNDNTTCANGQTISGGLNISERDGQDSLAWAVTNLLPNTVRWPYARIRDASEWDTCIYAPFPIVRIWNDAVALPVGAPEEYFLAQNYPNPFNPETEITYGITHSGLVTLRVYDVLGRQVAELLNQELSPGTYRTHFDGRELSSGVYIYTLSSAEGVRNHKMVLLK
jgi:hypothetical protein